MKDPRRDYLEREAELLRERFARTLAALDQRRHEMFNFRLQAKRHMKPISLTGVGLTLAAVTGVALLVRRHHNTPEYRLRQAWFKTRKALDKTVDQSLDAFNHNMMSLKKYWKKTVPRDLYGLL
jgi:hypothetical protein